MNLKEGRAWNGIIVSHTKEPLPKVCLILVIIDMLTLLEKLVQID